MRKFFVKPSTKWELTDEWGLTRVVTTRAEFDMERIKEEYLRRNSVPLDRAIAKDTHGAYEDILLALIGHAILEVKTIFARERESKVLYIIMLNKTVVIGLA